jgi:hypothetical protein
MAPHCLDRARPTGPRSTARRGRWHAPPSTRWHTPTSPTHRLARHAPHRPRPPCGPPTTERLR